MKQNTLIYNDYIGVRARFLDLKIEKVGKDYQKAIYYKLKAYKEENKLNFLVTFYKASSLFYENDIYEDIIKFL